MHALPRREDYRAYLEMNEYSNRPNYWLVWNIHIALIHYHTILVTKGSPVMFPQCDTRSTFRFCVSDDDKYFPPLHVFIPRMTENYSKLQKGRERVSHDLVVLFEKVVPTCIMVMRRSIGNFAWN